MADGNRQVTVDTWSELTAKMILSASKSSDTGVTMLQAGRVVIALLAELEFGGQDLSGYGSGWLELVRDYCEDRLKDQN